MPSLPYTERHSPNRDYVSESNTGLSSGKRQSGRTRHQNHRKGEPLARQLGWLSIGLGLFEIAAPQKITEWLGIRNEAVGMLRLCGMREVASGVGLLAQRGPASPWIISRIAGDIIDVAGLGAAATKPGADRQRIVAATMVVAGITALDWVCLQRLNDRPGREMAGEPLPVKKSVAVNRPVEDVYRFWRDVQNLPNFMVNVMSVRVTDDRHSHWVVQAPGGTTVEWNAEITDDQPNELIAWQTLEGSQVRHTGSVRFLPGPGGRGTVVTVNLHYQPPGGSIGATVASLMGKDPGQQVQEDLRRFKQVMETGEVVLSEGSLYGTGLKDQRPGQPPA